MQTCRLAGMIVAVAVVSVLAGCASEELRVQNDLQRNRIADLESQVQAAGLQLDQFQRQVSTAGNQGDVRLKAMEEQNAALKEDVDKKKALIAAMQERLLGGGGQLPVELSAKLEDLVGKYPMISFDSGRGMLKFDSDVLFEKGSDVVAPESMDALKALCGILNSEEAKRYDVIIAGHTDDIPVLKPETKAKHPTNWHLSAHRAISVLDIMTAGSVDPKRLSFRGFGEYHPVEPNKGERQGNPKNRRVEVYLVPKGM